MAVRRDEVSERDARHAGVMACARGEVNDDLLARILASHATGGGALPAGWGLSPPVFAALMAYHFPGSFCELPAFVCDTPRAEEVADIVRLLVNHRAGRSHSENWMATIVATACLGSNHLWQDLGLWSRADLGRLMQVNFPALAAKNVHDMKWKKFLYKQLCLTEGIYACRAPSCEVCSDFDACFGPEE